MLVEKILLEVNSENLRHHRLMESLTEDMSDSVIKHSLLNNYER